MRNDYYTCHSERETIALGMQFGQSLSENSIVCFFGDLGAGKTTFIKGVAHAVAHYPIDQVNSPTFVYLNIYSGLKNVYHFDLYRLRDSDEFLSMGFDEMFTAGGICCVEWSEKIAELLPPHCLYVTMSHAGDHQRVIRISDTWT